MYSNSSNVRNLIVPFTTSDLVENLFLVIQSIAAGTASLSLKMLNMTCVEWKIQLSPKPAIIILRFEYKCDENERVPVIDYKIINQTSGTGDDVNVIKHLNNTTLDKRRKNRSALYNLKEEIPELLLVLNYDENINDKEDNPTKSGSNELNGCTLSISHTMNNLTESIDSSSIKELCDVTASYSKMPILQTEGESGNGDDQSKCLEKSGNDNGISSKKGKRFERKSVTKQRKRICTRVITSMSGKSRRHLYRRNDAASDPKVKRGNGDDDDEWSERSERFRNDNISRRKKGKAVTGLSVKKQHKIIRSRGTTCISDKGRNLVNLSHTLTTYKTTDTVRKSFTCEECGKYFKFLSSLIHHHRIHTGEKPFKCEICGKFFTSSNMLSVHMRIHTGEKPFKCNVCNKSFTQAGTLNLHKRDHTGDKPFKCEICSKFFTTPSNLSVHMRIHTGEKPFKCEMCGRSFYTLYILTNHKRIHTGEKPFKCEICSKFFTTPSNLSVHMRIHTGEKPFKCEVCGRSFSTLFILTNHKRIHTGEKPFKCNVCEKSFTQAVTLNLHKRSHRKKTF